MRSVCSELLLVALLAISLLHTEALPMNKKVTRDSGRVRKSQDQDQDPVADVYETMDSLKQLGLLDWQSNPYISYLVLAALVNTYDEMTDSRSGSKEDEVVPIASTPQMRESSFQSPFLPLWSRKFYPRQPDNPSLLAKRKTPLSFARL